MSGGLQELRDSIYEVTLTINDTQLALPILDPPVDILHEVRDGNGVKWIVKNYSPDVEAALRKSPIIAAIRSRPVNLEDLFVACTRPQRSVGE